MLLNSSVTENLCVLLKNLITAWWTSSLNVHWIWLPKEREFNVLLIKFQQLSKNWGLEWKRTWIWHSTPMTVRNHSSFYLPISILAYIVSIIIQFSYTHTSSISGYKDSDKSAGMYEFKSYLLYLVSSVKQILPSYRALYVFLNQRLYKGKTFIGISACSSHIHTFIFCS